LSPSPQSEYVITPTLSVDAVQARLTLVCVTTVTWRFVGCEGGVVSGVGLGGRGRADAGAPAATVSATATKTPAAIRTNLRARINVSPLGLGENPGARHYARISDAVLVSGRKPGATRRLT
jgi:hypothetical protein